jgi:uncharacterized membrane protein
MSQASLPAPQAFTDQQILTNLIRQEWRLCRGTVTTLAMLWLSGLWVLVIFNHPGWLLAIGLLHLLLVSPAQAGRDVLDGSEEFSFAQPPGRGPLYLARLVPGLAVLLANGVVGGLAIAGNWPQALWSLCFSGGLTEPFAAAPRALWYYLAVWVPVAAHGVTFAVAANAGSRSGVNASWLGGAVVVGLVLAAALVLEQVLWGETNGFLACPALLATTVLALLAGYLAYLRKEATGSGGVAGRTGGGWAFAVIAVIVVLLVFLLLTFSWMRRPVAVNREVERAEAMQAEERAAAARSRATPAPPAPVPTPASTPERNSN